MGGGARGGAGRASIFRVTFRHLEPRCRKPFAVDDRDPGPRGGRGRSWPRGRRPRPASVKHPDHAGPRSAARQQKSATSRLPLLSTADQLISYCAYRSAICTADGYATRSWTRRRWPPISGSRSPVASGRVRACRARARAEQMSGCLFPDRPTAIRGKCDRPAWSATKPQSCCVVRRPSWRRPQLSIGSPSSPVPCPSP